MNGPLRRAIWHYVKSARTAAAAQAPAYASLRTARRVSHVLRDTSASVGGPAYLAGIVPWENTPRERSASRAIASVMVRVPFNELHAPQSN